MAGVTGISTKTMALSTPFADREIEAKLQQMAACARSFQRRYNSLRKSKAVTTCITSQKPLQL
jgi:hypothetical protein